MIAVMNLDCPRCQTRVVNVRETFEPRHYYRWFDDTEQSPGVAKGWCYFCSRRCYEKFLENK